MPKLAMERAHLGRAERHIAEGEQRLTRHALLIERMRRRGERMDEAEAMQRRLEETLAVWRRHRAEVLRTIAGLAESGGS